MIRPRAGRSERSLTAMIVFRPGRISTTKQEGISVKTAPDTSRP